MLILVAVLKDRIYGLNCVTFTSYIYIFQLVMFLIGLIVVVMFFVQTKNPNIFFCNHDNNTGCLSSMGRRFNNRVDVVEHCDEGIELEDESKEPEDESAQAGQYFHMIKDKNLSDEIDKGGKKRKN